MCPIIGTLLWSGCVREAFGARWLTSVALSWLICRALGTQIISKGILIDKNRRPGEGFPSSCFFLSLVLQCLSQHSQAVLCRCSFQGILGMISSNCYQLESRKECICEWSFRIAISCHLREFIHLLWRKTVSVAGPHPTGTSFLGEGGRDKIFSLCYFLLLYERIWECCFDLSISGYIFGS